MTDTADRIARLTAERDDWRETSDENREIAADYQRQARAATRKAEEAQAKVADAYLAGFAAGWDLAAGLTRPDVPAPGAVVAPDSLAGVGVDSGMGQAVCEAQEGTCGVSLNGWACGMRPGHLGAHWLTREDRR